MLRQTGCIAATGRRLRELDEGGIAIVVVRSDSEDDIRDVVATYAHQNDISRMRALAGTYDPEARKRASQKSFTMREVTSYGTLKAAGFYGPFKSADRLRDGAGATPAYAGAKDRTLVDFLAFAVDPGNAYEKTPILIYIPSPRYLGQSVAGARGDADGLSEEHGQALYLLKLLSSAKRRGENRVLVVIGALPGETVPALDAEAYLLDVPYPDDVEVRTLIEEVYRENAEAPDVPVPRFIMTELCGLFRGFRRDRIRTTLQVAFARYRNPFANGAADLVEDIREAKLQLLKKTAGLTWRTPHTDTPGGLGNLVRWVRAKRVVFGYSEAARRHGVALPQGLIASGVPGTGKSFAAEWVARSLASRDTLAGAAPLPLLQLDMGDIMGRYQGESEARFKRALRLVEAMAPCVFFIDELDKNFSGVGSGGQNNASLDRIFGHLLVWLQDIGRSGIPVFVFATANHLEKIPDELMRLGRFDEKFFFFLPTAGECRAIAALHLVKHACMFSDVDGHAKGDADALARVLEERVIDPFLRVATARGKFLTGGDIAAIVNETFQELFTRGVERLPGEADRRAVASAAEPVLAVPLDEVRETLIAKLIETHVFGETSREQLTGYWLWAERANPRNVSDDPLMLPYEGYQRRTGRFAEIAPLELSGLDELKADEYRARIVRAGEKARALADDAPWEDVARAYGAACAAMLATEIFDARTGGR